MNDSPGLLLVERTNDCVKALRDAGLTVARVPVEWVRAVDRTRGLTEREQSVLRLLVRGLTYEAIAGELKISQKTVGSYIQRVREKTRSRSRQELMQAAADYGITP